ncbi:hypothetical protein BGX38DRAFT_1233090 [Terfezia claveryi]|nr:hypothetical protein BGX38DRAFT_1233090 [Terfezia claveryi]
MLAKHNGLKFYPPPGPLLGARAYERFQSATAVLRHKKVRSSTEEEAVTQTPPLVAIGTSVQTAFPPKTPVSNTSTQTTTQQTTMNSVSTNTDLPPARTYTQTTPPTTPARTYTETATDTWQQRTTQGPLLPKDKVKGRAEEVPPPTPEAKSPSNTTG